MMKPRHFLLSGLAALAMTGAAFAADVPIRGPIYAKAPPSAFSWDGWYIGVHGGYAVGSFDSSVAGAASALEPSGGLGGVQIGFLRHLTPHWVIGIEIDVSAGAIDDTVGASRVDLDYIGTARTRLGYATGPWLFYATGGTAWTRGDFATAGFASRQSYVGWTVGGGIEYAFAPNWSAKLEYQYLSFDDTSGLIGATGFNSEFDLSVIKFGVNYRFADAVRPVSADAFPTKAAVRGYYNWTGPYIGLHAGYGDASYDSVAAGALTAFNPSGGFGGFQSGMNWQFSRNLVFGLEGDASFGSLRERLGGLTGEIDSFGTARASLGYAMDNILFYGTGGFAWAHNDSTSAGPAVLDNYFLGWAAGFGIEYGLSERWSIKAEYLHLDFSDNTQTAAIAARQSLDADIYRIGVNYRASIWDLFTRR